MYWLLETSVQNMKTASRIDILGNFSYVYAMQMKLELVAVPVSDADRAKAFYTEKIGFNNEVERQRLEPSWSESYQSSTGETLLC